MGEMIEFPSNGSTAIGYLATPPQGRGPGVIVIQEWWGLVDHIRKVCDRFAEAGFVALAPDLYHGVTVAEPDEAAKAMMALKMDQALSLIHIYLEQYAGEPLTTGAQAEAYADHFIAVHLSEMPLGGVYAKVSAASRANPSNTTLAAEVQTSFEGTTLRGLLLEAYAFSEFGLIALWAAIAAFVLAGVMALLVAFGFWHARRVPENKELAVHHEAERVLATV